jgi:HEAT repeat protein
MRRALLLCLLGATASAMAPRDLDVGIPPGTPLEWNREFRQPVPTGARGQVPSLDRPTGPGTTVAEAPKPNLDYVVSNLYDYFRVTTVDIMTHVSVNLPKSTGKVSQDDVATGGGFVMAWNYPPEMPTELVWMGAMACIREWVHPEVVCWPEIAAYLLELGEPAFEGSKAVGQGKAAQYVRKLSKPLPKEAPPVPKSKSPGEALAFRLAAVELSGGFPHALDPTFARRTLGLGEEGYFAVLECTKSSHPFLARNAVVVLAHFARTEASDELVKLFRESPDPVVRVRALAGMLRRSAGKPVVPDLVKLLKEKDEPMKALALNALGSIGDPAAAPALREAALSMDEDVLWSAIPALGRLRDGSKESREALLAVEKALERKYKGTDVVKVQGGMGTPSAEESGARWKVLHQMAVVALAVIGESRFQDEVVRRTMDLHPATHYLACEALAGAGEKGVEALRKKVVDAAGVEEIVKLEAMRRLSAAKKLDAAALKELATGKAGASVRALSLQLLAGVDEKVAKETCAKIVTDYGTGAGEVKADEAFVVASAAQVGGRLGGLKAAELVKAVERAIATKAFARREGKNEADITKAEVKLHPALLETLIVELGRTGEAVAAPTLIAILVKTAMPQGRPEAALALGGVRTKEGIALLLRSIEDDPDGWVRYCAYKSLKAISKEDHVCDWIFGDKAHRSKLVEKYKEWARK